MRLGSRRLLLTGGAGFFGRHLAAQLVRDGWAVRILDQAPPPTWVNEFGLDYAQGDICDPRTLAAAVDGMAAVVHAAFAPPERTSSIIRRVNVDGTRALLAACHAPRQGTPRVVLLSSTIVGRPLRPHPLLAGAPSSRLAVYRQSRVDSERHAFAAAAAGLSVAIARPKTILGPGGFGGFALIFELIHKGLVIPVLGRGSNRYQLLDVRDLVVGLSLLVDSTATGCFSFGAERFATVTDDLGALVDHAASGARLRHLPATLSRVGLRLLAAGGATPLSEWHQLSARGRDSVVDIARASGDLGWRPKWSNAETLIDAYDWYAKEAAGPSTPSSTHGIPPTHRLLGRWARRDLGWARHSRPEATGQTIGAAGSIRPTTSRSGPIGRIRRPAAPNDASLR